MLSNIEWIRSQFPALSLQANEQPVAFLDGPGGTQVPQMVIDAIAHYLISSNANAHGAFATSERTDEVLKSAHEAMADFLGCQPHEVVFGPNMTTLTFAMSRAIGRQLKPGDEILVTAMDHDANVSPWLALKEQGIIVRTVDIHPEDCTLDMADLDAKLTSRTRLVAVTYASNAVGTVNHIPTIVRMAHDVGAWVFVDAVHYAAHGPIDVTALDCDFLVCSPYKFCGPHVGVLYGKQEHLEQLHPYKVRPAPDTSPGRWETGTQNHEGLAGVVATIEYLATLGRQIAPGATARRDAIVAAMHSLHDYGACLSNALIDGLLKIPTVKIYGITELDQRLWRVPTVAIRMVDQSPALMAKHLGDQGIYTWHGHFYAINLTRRLGVEEQGGLLRLGLVHYNTLDEVERLLNALELMVPRPIAIA